MVGLRVLFLSSHVGLGHVARDYAIAVLLRRLRPGVVVEWCSAEPVLGFLRVKGERLAGGCGGLESFSTVIEDLYNGRVGGLRDLASRLSILRRNYQLLAGMVDFGSYELVFADEFWEVVYAAPDTVKEGVVFATDIVYKPYTLNPLDSLLSLILNRYFKRVLPRFRRLVYLNDLGMLEGRRWYWLFGGDVAGWVRRHMVVAGLATSYPPGGLPGRGEARRRLGLGDEDFVVVVSVGGTSTRSRVLLDCIDRLSRPLAERLSRIAGGRVRIVAVPGPRTAWRPRGGVVEVLEDSPAGLHDYYAAGDLFIVRAGRTTTADLLCAGKPAVLVPIKGHFEQEEIAGHMARAYGYPVLPEDQCSLEGLMEAVVRALRLKPRPPAGLCRGVEVTARLLAGMLGG